MSSPFWAQTEESLLGELSAEPEGLTSMQAAERLTRDGPNQIEEHELRGRLKVLADQVLSPIMLILAAATVLSMVLGDVVDGTIILVIIVAGAVLGAWQEHSADRAVAALLLRVQVRVEVLRDGQERSVRPEELVRGDMVVLRAGDIIPADCRLLAAHELLIDESALTGESEPAEKSVGTVEANVTPGRRSNAVFRGTHVVSGTGKAIVARTGRDTEFGHIADQLTAAPNATGFERGVTEFGLLLIRAMVVLVTVVFVLNVVLARPVIDSVLFSLALAVGLTPQMLPAIVAISLASGARLMVREQVIVKRLDAIEDFGSMTILCVDKTGTITAGVASLDAAVSLAGDESDEVLRLARMNAGLQQGFVNALDQAILGETARDSLGERLDEVPYDFQRKRLSVLVLDRGESTLITKGAFDQVLETCAFAHIDRRQVPVSDLQDRIQTQFERASAEGFRVLALATRLLPGRHQCSASDEQQMTLRGLLLFRDPPKEGAKAAIDKLRALGISVRVVTGDNRLAAAKIAADVGISTRTVMRGPEISSMSDSDLARAALECYVFAEVEPLHKHRIVRALRSHGAVVGFLGDGINDAPALHIADVGISVDTAVDVAKQAAAIVLLDKSLSVVADGVVLGRRTFANTLKYIRVTVSANFGNVLSIAAATAFLPFLPLFPRQILLLNFLSDIPAVTLSNDSVDEEQLQRPSAWDVKAIRNFMIVFGLVSSTFDLATFGFLRNVLDADAPLFRSAWFVESTLTELAVLLVLRTHRPFYRSSPAKALLWTSIGVAVLTFAIPFSPLNDALGMVHLPLEATIALIALTAVYILANEFVKRRMLSRLVAAPTTSAEPP
ncbi:MAG: magnesium-translocating P-type ATPase [Dehalococcoidia bacterium]